MTTNEFSKRLKDIYERQRNTFDPFRNKSNPFESVAPYNTYNNSPSETPVVPEPPPEIRKCVVLKGTQIFVYNEEDGFKHRQELSDDFLFSPDDILFESEDGSQKQISLNKGKWKWIEVDSYDIYDVALKPRPTSIRKDGTQLIQTSNESYVDWEKEMAAMIANEIDHEIIEELSRQANKYTQQYIIHKHQPSLYINDLNLFGPKK